MAWSDWHHTRRTIITTIIEDVEAEENDGRVWQSDGWSLARLVRHHRGARPSRGEDSTFAPARHGPGPGGFLVNTPIVVQSDEIHGIDLLKQRIGARTRWPMTAGIRFPLTASVLQRLDNLTLLTRRSIGKRAPGTPCSPLAGSSLAIFRIIGATHPATISAASIGKPMLAGTPLFYAFRGRREYYLLLS